MRDFRNPRYKVLRDREECIECDLCVRQCANEVHYRDEKTGALRADSMKCVNCQRCTLLCPTRALAITRWPQVDAGSAVWTEGAMDDITAQAQTGGVLLASMGNPKSYHIYWEHLLLNASQVTNPSIDPLREPMETRVVLGSRPSKLRVNERTRTVVSPLPPQLSLDVPIMFSAMSFGSVSLNTQKALAMAARELGTYFNCGEGGLHRDLEPYADRAIVQVASGRFGVDPHYLNAGAAIEIKIGQGAKPGIGGHLPGEKINEEVSRTRMIPEGTDAISPAPHHDIYSIEDLRQLIFSLKEATGYAKPVAVKVADEADAALLIAQEHLVRQLANVEEFDVAVEASKPAESAVVLGSGLEVYIVLAGHVDFAAERARLVKEREGVAKDAAKFEKKLSNPGFLTKAAPEIVEKDRAKLADLTDKLARLDAQIAELG